jgi:hypothetical protein
MDNVVDRLKHALQVIIHITIPEPDDSNPQRLQVLLALTVMLLLIAVRVAVKLNGQLQSRAVEIHNVWADRLLAAKLHALELLSAQTLPENSLR